MASDQLQGSSVDVEEEQAPQPDALHLVDEDTDFLITARPEAADPQPSLFSADELAIPKQPPQKYDELQLPVGGISQYRKGIAALHSVPTNGSHTLNSRRIMDAIVALVQIHFKRLPKPHREMLLKMEASPVFRVSRAELREMAGIQSKSFDRVKEVLERLHDMKINWNVLGEDAQVQWEMKSRFLASYGIGQGVYEGQVCFSIDPRVLELVLEPRLWVSLHLDVQKQLGTETSYALYQNTWRYIGTTNKVTASFATATWIELLMGPCRYVKTLPNGDKRVVDYSEWKARYLKPAIEKINNVSALAHTLELIEIRSSLKVRRLQFKFVPKLQAKLDLPVTWDEPVVEALKSLGFQDNEIAVLSHGFSLDEVVESLNRFRGAENKKKALGQRIVAPKAFFNGILNNVNTQASLDDEAVNELEKKARAEEAEARAKDAQERATYEFNAFQTGRLVESLDDWLPERRQELLSAFEASPDFPKVRPLLTNGWDKPGKAVWTMLKSWLLLARPADFYELLPNPEDRSLEAWLMWRLSKEPVEKGNP